MDSARRLADNADQAFRESLDDDLNISGALGKVFEFVNEANRSLDRSPDPAAARRLQETLEGWDRVLGVLALVPQETTLDAEVEALIGRRNEARAAKDYAAADRIRAELEARGIILEDTKERTKWKRAR